MFQELRGEVAALLHGYRLDILILLGHGSMRSNAIADVLGVEPSVVSHALRHLRSRGLVEREGPGRTSALTLTRRVRIAGGDADAAIRLDLPGIGVVEMSRRCGAGEAAFNS